MIRNSAAPFNFDLGESADMIRESARRFTDDEIAPRAVAGSILNSLLGGTGAAFAPLPVAAASRGFAAFGFAVGPGFVGAGAPGFAGAAPGLVGCTGEGAGAACAGAGAGAACAGAGAGAAGAGAGYPYPGGGA